MNTEVTAETTGQIKKRLLGEQTMTHTAIDGVISEVDKFNAGQTHRASFVSDEAICDEAGDHLTVSELFENLNIETKERLDPKLLAIEGNGAVEVAESPDMCPLIVTIVGPIRVWWTEWDSPRHQQYTEWRDAVRVALVKAGCAVYSPHRAIQGSWNERLQKINDAAIESSDLVVVMTPDGVPANGTAGEMRVAEKAKVPMYNCPPDGPEGIEALLEHVKKLQSAMS